MNLHCSDTLLLNSTIDDIKNAIHLNQYFLFNFFIKFNSNFRRSPLYQDLINLEKNIIINNKTTVCRDAHYT